MQCLPFERVRHYVNFEVETNRFLHLKDPLPLTARRMFTIIAQSGVCVHAQAPSPLNMSISVAQGCVYSLTYISKGIHSRLWSDTFNTERHGNALRN